MSYCVDQSTTYFKRTCTLNINTHRFPSAHTTVNQSPSSSTRFQYTPINWKTIYTAPRHFVSFCRGQSHFLHSCTPFLTVSLQRWKSVQRYDEYESSLIGIHVLLSTRHVVCNILLTGGLWSSIKYLNQHNAAAMQQSVHTVNWGSSLTANTPSFCSLLWRITD